MFRKLTIAATLILGSICSMISQTLSIGPVAGINISKFTANTASKNLVGMSIGALANYSINEHGGISAKLLFSQLGSKYTNTNGTTRLNYLQMPISLVYYFGDAGTKFRPKIYAGPYFGTLLSAKDENKNDIHDASGLNPYKKHDIGGQFGLGFNYLLKSRTWLNLDLGYGGSFTDISKSDNEKEHNSAITFKLGISFPVGER
jgi:Outer membrane protein beta-barrel domain